MSDAQVTQRINPFNPTPNTPPEVVTARPLREWARRRSFARARGRRECALEAIESAMGKVRALPCVRCRAPAAGVVLTNSCPVRAA